MLFILVGLKYISNLIMFDLIICAEMSLNYQISSIDITQ